MSGEVRGECEGRRLRELLRDMKLFQIHKILQL